MEGLAVHTACVRTEVPLCELPAKGPKARVDFNTSLFETPLQLLDDFVDQDEVVQQNIFTNPPDTFDPELVSYRVVQLSGTQFVAALKKIAGIVQ